MKYAIGVDIDAQSVKTAKENAEINNEIIKRMQDEHKIEAVILGCTELPLILNDENCMLPCLDSVAIHIERLVELAQDGM